MIKRIVFVLVLTIILAGCSPDKIPPLQEDVNEDVQHQQQDEQVVESTLPKTQENNEENEVPKENGQEAAEEVGETVDTGEQVQGQTEQEPLINKEETALMFINAWREIDLEKMDMLTFHPLEEFFDRSDIFFASYYYIKNGDLAGYIRDGIETLKVYDQNAFDNIEIIQLPGAEDILIVRMGKSFELDFDFIQDDNMWKIKIMDSLPVQLTKAIPEDWTSLNNTVICDMQDVNRDGFIELLTMGYWGEWEGIGPEPSSALGIYIYNGEEFKTLYFKGIEDRLNENKVLIEGASMGHLIDNQSIVLVLAEKSAVDQMQAAEQHDVKYFLSLYGLEDGELMKIEEIDWSSLIKNNCEHEVTPKWLEVLGVKNLEGTDKENIIIKAGLEMEGSNDGDIIINEGIFVLSKEGEEWKVEWSHIGIDGEYHTIIFDQPNQNNHPCRLYYIEDHSNGDINGWIYEVSFEEGEWIENLVFCEKLDIKAVADMDGDGIDEFLVWDRGYLKILSHQGRELWHSEEMTGTREIPYAWMGRIGEEQRIVAALHRGTQVYWRSQITGWKGNDYDLQLSWDSEELGTEGISAVKVVDIEGDGEMDILANFSNNYLVRGQYFKVFRNIDKQFEN